MTGVCSGKVRSTSPVVLSRASGDADFAGMTAGDGSVWVTDTAAGTVVRIDAKTNKPSGKPIAVGTGPTGVALGEGAVWVTNLGDGTVSRIDPQTGTVVGEPIALGGQPVAVATGEGVVWVLDQSGSLVPLDPESGEPGERISIGGRPAALAVTGDAVWVADPVAHTVTRVTP